MFEKELKYREIIYGENDIDAFNALDELYKEKATLDVPVALGFIDVEGNDIINDFRICSYLCIQRLWEWVMKENPSHNMTSGLLPIEQISYNDIKRFLRKLNRKFPGYNFELPTEDEWLYAANGGNKSQGFKYAGSDVLDDVAWYAENSDGKSHPVGKKKPNELGMYDVIGNMFEYVKHKRK